MGVPLYVICLIEGPQLELRIEGWSPLLGKELEFWFCSGLVWFLVGPSSGSPFPGGPEESPVMPGCLQVAGDLIDVYEVSCFLPPLLSTWPPSLPLKYLKTWDISVLGSEVLCLYRRFSERLQSCISGIVWLGWLGMCMCSMLWFLTAILLCVAAILFRLAAILGELDFPSLCLETRALGITYLWPWLIPETEGKTRLGSEVLWLHRRFSERL